MAEHKGRFAWYELMTPDMASARAFYTKVVGWGAEDASAPHLAYTLFTSGKMPVCGLMDLPEEARRMGATARWMGYVAVEDAEATAGRLKRLGGVVYVPPTDSNIGRVSVVADPHKATLALIQGLSVKGSNNVQHKAPEPNKPGRVGWHELLTIDPVKALDFYTDIFDWKEAETDVSPAGAYQLFTAGGEMAGGMFNKRPKDLQPFWLFYFNIGDIDAAADRVEGAGGQVLEGPFELPGGSWVVRCKDPQGATFALQGKRSQDGIAQAPASEVSWSTAWGGISSRGRMVVTKPRNKAPASDE